MDAHAWKTVGRGLAVGVTYFVAFSILWRNSVDQWYLPAGLRLASLLLLPMRYWPYVFAGDAAALLVMRVPKAEQYSAQWAYLSPFLFIPVYSLVPYYARKKLVSTRDMVLWLPLIAIFAAIVTSVWAMTLNYALSGPRPNTAIDNFVRFAIGDYFGIMLVILPILLWRQRGEWLNTRRHIMQSIAIAMLAIAGLYAAASIPGVQGLTARVIPLALMLIAIAYLTLLHGWHGAAVGTLLVSAALAPFALPRIEVTGAADDALLMAQIVLAIASAIFLVGGVYLSKLHERSGESLRNELLVIQLQQKHADDQTRTMSTVRSMIHSFEQSFREKSLLLAYARDDLDAYRNAVAQTLKNEGLYQQAMDAISAGVESSRALERHSELLYPFEIETYGLDAVLLSEYFQERWNGRVRLRCTLSTPSSKQPPLSLPLQLAAYRAICNAMDMLTVMAPTDYIIQVRRWRRGGRKGITVFIDCSPTTVFALTSDVQRALQTLAIIVRAHDGTFQHRHTHRIGFLLSEPLSTP